MDIYKTETDQYTENEYKTETETHYWQLMRRNPYQEHIQTHDRHGVGTAERDRDVIWGRYTFQDRDALGSCAKPGRRPRKRRTEIV